MALTKIAAAGLTADLIDETKLADDSIDSEHYIDGSIDNAHLADDAVGVDELSATGTAGSTTYLRGDNSWTVPPDTNTTYSVGDGGLTQNNFTNTLKTKLDGIEASATADQTGAQIKTAYEAESDTNAFTDADHTKLDGIAASANNYVHPNHSGDVTSTADGATVIAAGAVDIAMLATGTDGKIITWDANGAPTVVGPGTDGQVLTSTGAGSPPAFEALPTSGATLSGSTNNTVVTVTGANAMIGEATLTYDGTNLQQKQTGNTATQIILDSNRSAADNEIGGLIGKWDTETVADIRFLTDDDTSNKDNGYISFRTSTASGSLNEHLRIKPAGDVQITDGNVTFASGHGISFAADASSATSLGSELLDDYEQGTWSPTMNNGGSSITTSNTYYCKVGNLVTITCNLESIGTENTGTLQISGIPFTPISGGNARGACAAHSINSGHSGWITADVRSSDIIAFIESNAENANWADMQGSELDSGYLVFTITYVTT